MKKTLCLQIAILVVAYAVMAASPASAQSNPSCVRGNAKAPILVEVFSDFQCPGCAAFYIQTMRQVFANYADKGTVCVVYFEYPGLAYSREAARFARAALRLGVKQWGLVTDALFESQSEWARTGRVGPVVASALGAKDMDTVRTYLEGTSLDDAIDEDIIEGYDRKVNSTPTFFITANGKTEKIEAALTYAAMQRRFDEILKGRL